MLAALVRDVGFCSFTDPPLRAGGRGGLRPAAQNALIGKADRDETPPRTDEGQGP